MAIIPPPWRVRASEITPPEAWWSRRELLARLGMAAAAAIAPPALAGALPDPAVQDPLWPYQVRPLAGVTPNPAYTVDRPVTAQRVAASHNNYYELTTEKSLVWHLAGKLPVEPWTIEVAGLVERPLVLDLADLIRELGVEERTYRFRCVEAWAATVPWDGIPLAKVITKCRPLSGARYVAFHSDGDPRLLPGITRQPWYPWPYHEALRMDEAMHPLTLLAVGAYGQTLPGQHGAPARLIIPWKYGFKGAKRIVRLVFTARQPKTFWNEAVPDEYDFYANVRPDIPHPRWSQAVERLIPDGEEVPTRPYNGYADLVAGLYASG